MFVFEGLVKDLVDVDWVVCFGVIMFFFCYEYDVVGFMVGVIFLNMYVYIIKNEMYGNMVFINLSE